ncbi:hypothetical protein [Streptomyces sp. NBC_01497]|uniref:hypothetical protein n=1 Tax=Streptomyces sp. NBC_01497 TaxID=2903885 RepID=UPI002E2EC6F5|nr:hypothetical protein [Streptomyces sp. NBC_01497]
MENITQNPTRTRSSRPARPARPGSSEVGRTGDRTPAQAFGGILVRILKEPFRAATWRRFAYLVLALPVGLLCVPLALVGGPAGRLQRGLARSLLGAEVPEPGRTGPLAFVHAVLSAPLNLVAVVVSGYFWTVVVMNIGYPLRPDTTAASLAHSWGGPSLAGAWAVHGLGGGVPFLFLTPWVMRGFTALQTQLVRALLSGPASGFRPGPDAGPSVPDSAAPSAPVSGSAPAAGSGTMDLHRGRAVALALGVSAVCAVLSIPVIHQL